MVWKQVRKAPSSMSSGSTKSHSKSTEKSPKFSICLKKTGLWEYSLPHGWKGGTEIPKGLVPINSLLVDLSFVEFSAMLAIKRCHILASCILSLNSNLLSCYT